VKIAIQLVIDTYWYSSKIAQFDSAQTRWACETISAQDSLLTPAIHQELDKPAF